MPSVPWTPVTAAGDALGGAILVVDLAGVLGNAILGGIAARSARLDLVGFVVLATLSGLGGGIIRDTLLQQGAPLALTEPQYLVLALVGAAIAFVVRFTGRWSRRTLTLIDALAVGCWAAVGAQKALAAGLGWLPAILLGVITAVGGGMVRDLFLLRVPAIFGGNTLYATGALIASAEMVILVQVGQPNIGFAVAIVTASAISLVARRQGWRLPGPVELKLGSLTDFGWGHRRTTGGKRTPGDEG